MVGHLVCILCALALEGDAASVPQKTLHMVKFIGGVHDGREAVARLLGTPLLHFTPGEGFMALMSADESRHASKLSAVAAVRKVASADKVSDAVCTVESLQLVALLTEGSDVEASCRAVENMARRSKVSVAVVGASPVKMVVTLAAKDNCRAVVALLVELPTVHWVTSVMPVSPRNKFAKCVVQSGSDARSPLMDRGIRGERQVVATADTGIDGSSCFFHDPAHPMPNGVSDDHRKVRAYFAKEDADDVVNGHGTHVAGSMCGAVQKTHNASAMVGSARDAAAFGGVAPMAKIVFTDIGRSDGSLHPPVDLVHGLFTDVYDAGARIDAEAWGTDTPAYTTHAHDIDSFTWDHKDFLVLVAAGNAGVNGLYSIGAPATAKNAVAVGASQNSKNSFDYDTYNYGCVVAAPVLGANITAKHASFSSILPAGAKVSAVLAIASPPEGCAALAPVRGAVVLLRRGSCDFATKVQNAQEAGAYAAVVMDTSPNGTLLMMGGKPKASIPAVFVSFHDGDLLARAVGSTVSLFNPTFVAGLHADDDRYSHTNLAHFSARGPTLDFRAKPDIVTPGEFVVSARSDGPDGEPHDPWGANGAVQCGRRGTMALEGTSMAAPLAAGAAALVRQYFMEGWYPSGEGNPPDGFAPSAALLKAVLVNSGVRLTGLLDKDGDGSFSPLASLEVEREERPSFYQGFGRVQLDRTLYFRGNGWPSLWVRDASRAEQTIRTGHSQTICFLPRGTSDEAMDLKITLVWTDPPAHPAARFALVNDLDLTATIKGAVYAGNGGGAAEGTFDRTNNVEQVHARNLRLHPSEHIAVTVRGVHVPVGPQPYALVIAGAVLADAPKSCSVSCLKDCSGHGSCSSGLCACSLGWFGDACDIAPRELERGKQETISLAPMTWQYLVVHAPANSKTVSLHVRASAGTPTMFIQRAQLPSVASYEMSNFTSLAREDMTLELKVADDGRPIFVGVMAGCCDDNTFSIAIGTPTSELAGTRLAVLVVILLSSVGGMLMSALLYLRYHDSS